jgi:hypothetical protein
MAAAAAAAVTAAPADPAVALLLLLLVKLLLPHGRVCLAGWLRRSWRALGLRCTTQQATSSGALCMPSGGCRMTGLSGRACSAFN